MKYYMVCINPECDQHFHRVTESELIVAANTGMPVIANVTGDEPPVEAAIAALEVFLESNPEDKFKDLAYEKLKSLQAETDEDCTCSSCTEPKTSESVGSTSAIPSAADDYYQSADYKAHRVRMDALEIERVKEDILNQQAQTSLLNAKARLTVAEAAALEEKFRLSQIKFPQVK